MKKKGVYIGLGFVFVVLFVLGILYVKQTKNVEKTNIQKQEVKKEKKTIVLKKPMPAEKVEENIRKEKSIIDLSTSFIYADTAIGYAEKLTYAYDTKPVSKPMYTATKDELKKGVIVFKNLKPNTKYYYKVWINGNLYTNSAFTTKAKNWKKLEKLKKKIAKIKEGWNYLSIDTSKSYAYKNIRLAFVTGVEYSLTTGAYLDEKQVYKGESLKSGYILLTGLQKDTDYYLQVWIKNKVYKKQFKTTKQYVPVVQNSTTYVNNNYLLNKFEIKNWSGLVIKDGKVYINLDLGTGIQKITKVEVYNVPDYKALDKEVYNQFKKEIDFCWDVLKEVDPKNYEDRLNPITATDQAVNQLPEDFDPKIFFPYGWEEYLNQTGVQFKQDIQTCKDYGDKIMKTQQELSEKLQQEKELFKSFKIDKKLESLVLNGLENKDYEAKIFYLDSNGKEQFYNLYLTNKK